jgi:hypothetical protein
MPAVRGTDTDADDQELSAQETPRPLPGRVQTSPPDDAPDEIHGDRWVPTPATALVPVVIRHEEPALVVGKDPADSRRLSEAARLLGK